MNKSNTKLISQIKSTNLISMHNTNFHPSIKNTKQSLHFLIPMLYVTIELCKNNCFRTHRGQNALLLKSIKSQHSLILGKNKTDRFTS